MSFWMKSQFDPINEDTPVYSLDDAKKYFEVRQLCRDGYLVLNWDDPIDKNWLKFAVLEFFCSDADDTNILLSKVFYGEGPIGLRECRHTYWGSDDGDNYLFYPNGKVITAAFDALSEFYDDLK